MLTQLRTLRRTRLRSFAIAGLAALLYGPSLALAQTAPSLGTASSFAVLGGSTVTNTGSSIITGDVGVSPGTAVTGFPPGVVSGGTIHRADAVAIQAQNDVTTAYNALAAQTCTQNLTGQDLGTRTLTAGVYCFDAAAQLTGTLILDAQGNANAVFIFKIGTTLTTAANSTVVVANGGQNCNVFYQVGSSATLGTGTTLAGNILALTSITLTTGARTFGRTLARNGAVTLDTNNVDRSVCAGVPLPACPTLTIAPTTLANGTVAVAYSQTISASGGTGPYTFVVTTGALPAGLTLTAAGLLAGTPTTTGSYTFTVRGTDASGCFADRAYTIVIVAAVPPAGCPTISLTPATLPNGAPGVAYNQTITGSGGTGPYVFIVTSGTLPAGLTLTTGGVLSGTPTTAGTSSVTIRGTDANGCFASVTYSIVIAAVVPPAGCPIISLTPATLPNGAPGVAYSQTITGSGGTGPYVFSVTSGTLPAGLTLTTGGVLSGTPTTAGTSSVTIRGTDANGCFASVTYSIVIAAAVPTLAEWAMIGLALMLGLAGFLALRRRTA